VSLGTALCASASVALADDLAERTQDAIDALRSGDVPAAVAVLDDPSVGDALVARPALVHVLCDRAFRCDDAFRAAPVAARRTLSAALLDIAERAHTATPDDSRGLWALSHALVLNERAGPARGGDAWLRAAELLEDAYERAPGGGEALGYAVTFLVEGAVLEPDDEHALMKRAGALAKLAQRHHKAAPALATTIASAHLWGAGALLERNRKAAKSALQIVFGQLEPHVDRNLPRGAVPALWNDAVTLDATARFALRRRYVTVPAEALGGAVVFDVPVSPRWTVTHVPKTEEAPAYVYVTQTDAAGAPLRQLLFRSYRWGYSYPFVGPNEVKGDNVKNLARGLRDVSAERVFGQGADRVDVRKSRVGRGFVGQSFRVSGSSLGDEPAPLALHGYCVRGDHQVSFGFLVYVYGGDGEIDAEMESVLAGMREPEN
jgi:hypothetical protein